MRVTGRSKLVGFGGLIPMESGCGNLSYQDTATVAKENLESSAKLKRNLWLKDDICSRLKKSLEKPSN